MDLGDIGFRPSELIFAEDLDCDGVSDNFGHAVLEALEVDSDLDVFRREEVVFVAHCPEFGDAF